MKTPFFWGSKYHIPNDFVCQNPTLEEIDLDIEKHWTKYDREFVDREKFAGCGVCLLMTREMWFESTGLDERLIYWGWNDIDWHRRLVRKYRWDDLELHGMKMFHLEHFKNRKGDFTAELPRKMNPMNDPTDYAPNPPNWGLYDHHLSVVDGYGMRVDPLNRGIPGNDSIVVASGGEPVSAAGLLVGNPVYREVPERYSSLPCQAARGEEILRQLMTRLQPRTVCEQGSSSGTAAECLAGFPSVEKVYCVDHFDRQRLQPLPVSEFPRANASLFEVFLARAAQSGHADKLFPIRLDSRAGAQHCCRLGLSFDLIHLAGVRDEVSLRGDILRWRRLLNAGGVICGELPDSAQRERYERALMELHGLAQAHGWQLLGEAPIWMIVAK